MFRPQSAMLTLFGDYVLDKGDEIGIGSLVNLLGNFGLSESSTRSAVSRMCRSGLLKVRHANRRSYYSLTAEGRSLIAEGAQRIFRRTTSHWDGNWNIITYSIPERMRQGRDTLRTELGWMGYGALGEATWISPNELTGDVKSLLKKLDIEQYVHIFKSQSQDCTDPKGIVSGCWDLGKIHKKYADFLTEYQPKLEQHLKRLEAGEPIKASECFVARFNLMHEYRKLPFFDPDLPLELLPGNWLRPQASALFDEYHDTLTEKANEYFDCIAKSYRNAGTARGKR